MINQTLPVQYVEILGARASGNRAGAAYASESSTGVRTNTWQTING